MKTLRLTLTFYKSFLFVSLLITLSCMSVIATNGMQAFVAVFWFKIITLGLIVFFINNYKRNEFYYYKNLGLSKFRLWLSILLFDFILFIMLLIIAANIHEEYA